MKVMAIPVFLKRLRPGSLISAAVSIGAVLLVALGVYTFWPRGGGQANYATGANASRETCFYDRIRQYATVNKQVLFQIAQDCELTVQSIEGHAQMRREWEARQASKPAPAPVPVPAAAEPPGEKDQLRRVWR